MRRVIALLAGAVLAIGLFLSPVADMAVRALAQKKGRVKPLITHA